MRSVLTRSIIRQLLREEPLIFRGCLQRPRSLSPRDVRTNVCRPQRRTLFGFSMMQPASEKKEYNPGIAVMEEALKRQELRARMPPALDLVKAWQSYFRAKLDSQVLDIHTRYALVVFRHLQRQAEVDGKVYLDSTACTLALRAMAQRLESRVDIVDKSYNQLARELYSVLQKSSVLEGSVEERARVLGNYVSVLAVTGDIEEACDLLLKQPDMTGFENVWRTIFTSPQIQQDVELLRQSAQRLQKADDRVFIACRIPLIMGYCRLGALEEAKALFETFSESDWSLEMGKPPKILPSLEPMLRLCVNKQDLQYGQSIIQGVVERNLTTHHSHQATHFRAWELIFYWAAATGKSVEDIDRMMRISIKSGTKVPTVNILGQLMEIAHEKKDPYLGERYFALASSWGVKNPGLKVYTHLLALRLLSGDMDGAQTIWREVQDTPVRPTIDPTTFNTARLTINKLIEAMCTRRAKIDADVIMPVVDYLIKYFSTFETNTICALCTFHLRREEYHEVVDLLKTHVPRLSSQDRLQVRDTFVGFCLDRANPITRVWDAYMIFHQIFEAETDRVMLTKLMHEFYKRRQGKMALHVFNQMRDHTRADTIATEETYVDALVAISSIQHNHGLENVHNQLKLDMNVEPNTKILNALMLAYCMCGKPYTSWTFWRQITNSIEGPSFESILIVLRCCEFIPFGEQRAAAIWNQFQRLDIDVTPELFAGYVGALAANECIKEALELVEGAKRKYGVEVDEFILGTLLSTIPSISKQNSVERWIQDMFPDSWAALQKIGFMRRGEDVKVWKIDRSLTP